MNGWTPETTQVTRIENLFAQIPQEYQAIASRKCYGSDDHEFERKLTGYVLRREWEQHPADVASDLEAQYEKPQADEADWFTKTASVRNDEYNIPLDLIERHNAKVKADIFTHDPNCKHEKAFPTYGGMMCRCGAKFEARNEFEQRLVNARNPKGNGYVNWKLR